MKTNFTICFIAFLLITFHAFDIVGQAHGTYSKKKPKLIIKPKKRLSLGKYPRPEFENKFTISFYTGALIPLGGNKINAAGISENVFGNFDAAPLLGGSFFYNKTNKIAIGGSLKYANLFSGLYNMNYLSIGINLKYNFIPSDRKLSPYIIAGASFSMIGLKQSAYNYYYNPSEKYSLVEQNSILVSQFYYREPNVSIAFVPVFGLSIGAGLDYKLYKNLSVFLQIDYNANLSKHQPVIQKYYPHNKSDFDFILVSAGIKLKMIKNKNLY